MPADRDVGGRACIFVCELGRGRRRCLAAAWFGDGRLDRVEDMPFTECLVGETGDGRVAVNDCGVGTTGAGSLGQGGSVEAHDGSGQVCRATTRAPCRSICSKRSKTASSTSST